MISGRQRRKNKMVFKLPFKRKEPKTIEQLKEELAFLEAKKRFQEETMGRIREREELQKKIAKLKGSHLPQPFIKGFKKTLKEFYSLK